MDKLPKISVCIPTYNSALTIDACLKSIAHQNYPKNLIELLIIDGGSQDDTLSICKSYAPVIINNPFKIEEKGRVLGIRAAKGEVVAFIDADNICRDGELFHKMTSVFVNNEKVVFAEPKFYDSEADDDALTQYISLIGADDPVAVYLGIYDRYCYFKSDWTDAPYRIVLKNDMAEIIELKDIRDMPPLGANGCFIKKSALDSIAYDPFVHTDIVHRLLKNSNLFAKVHTGIIHKQDGSLIHYLRKKCRRLNRNYQELGREYYFPIRKKAVVLLLLKFFFIFPLILDAWRGYKHKHSIIWMMHPGMTVATMGVYATCSILKKISKRWN
jgi:glycosyltransferase involved in cell wall biosynthesis